LVVEVKPTSELKKLSGNLPEQWVREPSGWVFVPAKEHYSTMGLSHVIRATEDLSQIETNNLKTLVQFRKRQYKENPNPRRAILAQLQE